MVVSEIMNPFLALNMPGGPEIIILFFLILILFGAKKLPELAKGLGQGIREFKKASNEVTSELQRAAAADEHTQAQVPYRPADKIVEAKTVEVASAHPDQSHLPKA